MAISHDTNTSTSATDVSSLTWTHTCTGNNRVLVVGITLFDVTASDRKVSDIKYNGVDLTKIAHAIKSNVRSELWYLLDPATGANNIVATLGGVNTGAAGGGISLTGVDSLDANNNATGLSASPSVAVITAADNCWVIDVLVAASNPTVSVGADQIQRWSKNVGTSLRGRGSHEGPKTPSGSVTMSWSLGTSKNWGMVAASFAPNNDLTLNPPALAIAASFPNPQTIWDVFAPGLDANLTLPNAISVHVATPPALVAAFTGISPGLYFRMVVKLFARYRRSTFISHQRDTNLRARRRDTKLITEKRND